MHAMQESRLDNETRELVRQMQEHFLVPPNESGFFSPLKDLIPSLDTQLRLPAEAFIQSLSAILSTMSLPFALASASTEQQHYMRFHIAENIRGLSRAREEGESEAAYEARTERFIARRAAEHMQEFRNSKEGVNILVSQTCRFLLDGIRRGPIEEPAAELLLEGTWLSWSAFEVLSRDVFVTLVNSRPVLAQTLLNAPQTKLRFGLAKIPIDLLAQFGFDLSSQMGNLLASQQDFSDLATIKTVFQTLFPDNRPLREKLQARELWTLCQERHLIVHRRGVIDEEFRKNTDSGQTIGSRLRIKPAQLEEAIRLVQDTGLTILQATAG